MAPHIAILVNDWNELRFWTKSDHTITRTQGSIDGNQVSKAQPRGKPSVNPQLMTILDRIISEIRTWNNHLPAEEAVIT